MKMVLDVILHMDETVSIYGTVAIFDMKGVTWRHGLQMTPTIIKRYILYMPMAICLTLIKKKHTPTFMWFIPKTKQGRPLLGKLFM